MANPKTATTNQSGSRYYTWRGENYYSVTTIIGGGLPKPALINWAKKFTAEYACDHLEALNALVKDDREGAVDWLKNAAWRDRDKKAELGTHLHEAMEAYVLGKPFPRWDDAVAGRMLKFEKFLKDYEPVYEMTEATVFNKTYRYAGTLDAVVHLSGPPPGYYILDMKSGKAVYPEVALQLAMYRFAEFVGLPDGSEAPMPQVDGACALHLTDHDYQLVDVLADDAVFKTAMHVREVYRWQQELSKQVLRGELKVGVDPGVAAVGQLLLGGEETP